VKNLRTLNEIPSKFPRIAICNNNMFTTEYALEFLRNMSESMRKTKNDVDIFEIEKRKKFGNSLKDILHNCKFNTIPCNLDEFNWEFDPIYGNETN
jgi:hypothetical protein